MIKKQQKWIAMFVALTFMWLLHVSAMPLSAAQAKPQPGNSQGSDQPGVVEEVALDAGFHMSRRNALPYVIVGVGVVAAAAIILFSGILKQMYDIQGNWLFSWKRDQDNYWWGQNERMTFTGSKTSGNAALYSNGTIERQGPYTISKKNMQAVLERYQPPSPTPYIHMTLSGSFQDNNTITGTWDETGQFHEPMAGTFELKRDPPQ